MTKDTRTKLMVETTYLPAAFLATLADHIPDRYRHNVRYFGLLAPRVKGRTHDAVFAAVGQERLGKPKRVPYLKRFHQVSVARFSVHRILGRHGMNRLPANQKHQPHRFLTRQASPSLDR